MRAGEADRDAAAAALDEHFAQARLTLGELSARLDATLAATTYGEYRVGLIDGFLARTGPGASYSRKLRNRRSLDELLNITTDTGGHWRTLTDGDSQAKQQPW